MSGTCRDVNNTHLEEKFDSLDGGYSCFRDGSGDTTSQEVLGEGNGCLTHLQVFSDAVPLLTLEGLPVELKWPKLMKS